MRRAILPLLVSLALAFPAVASATGWRVMQRDGVWWFERADGTRFLSRGVDCLGPGVEAKDHNPQKPEYSFAHRRGDTYDKWKDRTLKRLALWGFDTIGGWSETRVIKSGWPYTQVLHLGIQAGAPWVDLWDPAFPKSIRRLAGELTATTRGDPNLIGYFLDNEFGWADEWFLGIALGWGSEAPGKHKLVGTLRGAYRNDWKAFARDFETNARDWDGLLSSSTTGRRAGRGHRAMDAWMFEVARRYNEVCAGILREIDPGTLILGDRYRQFYPQAVARAARGIVDAVSTNYESQTTDGWISPSYFRNLHELSGCPVIVGEYYATARQNRSGLRNHGGEFTLCDNQVQRGLAAAAQAGAYASMPFVIGWHWFQWCDEPTYGRGDGEDYNMGLVDIYDEPYAEFLAELVPALKDAERAHAASRLPEPARLPLGVARQEGLVADGKLGDWDKSRPVPRDLIRTDAPLLPFGEVFLAWDDRALRIAVRAYDFTIPGKAQPLAWDPATWGELHRLTLRVDDWKCRAATGKAHAEGKKDDEGHPVLFAVPPRRGEPSAALSSHIDQWHYVWEVAVPVEALGGTLAPGRKLQLSLTVENRGDFEKMWFNDLAIELEGVPGDAAAPRGYWYPADEPMPVRDMPVLRSAPPPDQYMRPVRPAVRPVEPLPPPEGGPVMRRPKKPAAPPGIRPAGGRPADSKPPAQPAPAVEPPAASGEEVAPAASGSADGEEGGEEPASGKKPAKERHTPEKPATPETKSPVPETKVVPGRPPAENPGNAEGR